MYASSTQAAGHIARRERLGIFQARPVISVPRPLPKPEPERKPRDVIAVMMPPPEDPEMLHDIPDNPVPAALMWRQIIREVCEKHNVSYIDICSARRQRNIVIARHEASWRLKNETTMSYPQIGHRLGNRDHTTILSSVRRYERMLAGEPYRDSHGRKQERVITANIEGDENGNVELG